jgi:hypothetical protein
MNVSSRKSATFSLDSNSSSVYSEDEFKSDANTTGTLVHHRSQLQPNLGGVHRENAQVFASLSCLPLTPDMATPDVEEHHGSILAVTSGHTAQYRFETHNEAEERRRRSAVEARQKPHEPWGDTILEEPTMYMQRMLAEHDDASASDFPALYRCEKQVRAVSADAGAVISDPSVPARSHRRLNSTASAPARNRDTLLSTVSAVSTDAGELAQEYILETTSLRNRLRKSMHVEDTGPSASEPRATSLSLFPSSPQLDHSSSPGENREVNRDAALQALSGATDVEDEIQPCGSGQWLGGHTSITARRQGDVDGRKGAMFSSSGQRYGMGDRNQGYVSGKYATVIQDSVVLGKDLRKRDAVKRLCCFGS